MKGRENSSFIHSSIAATPEVVVSKSVEKKKSAKTKSSPSKNKNKKQKNFTKKANKRVYVKKNAPQRNKGKGRNSVKSFKPLKDLK